MNRKLPAINSSKKAFIKIVPTGVFVREEPSKISAITCCLQSGQIQQVISETNVDDVNWFRISGGWICSRDSSGFLSSEPSNETEANKFWATELNNRKRIAIAVANVLIFCFILH